jgi:NADH dehydrogenase FAD-containing subunit
MNGAIQHRVVVLGGGFAGVYTARYLSRLLGWRRDVHVELLSEENYFVFQPLLPEVAAGGINPNHVVNPIRDLLPKAQFRWCRVIELDTARKVVRVVQGEGRALVDVSYDHLVFALGKVSDFSSMPGVEEHSLPLKDLDDAFRLRNHVPVPRTGRHRERSAGEKGAAHVCDCRRRVLRNRNGGGAFGAVAQMYFELPQYRIE